MLRQFAPEALIAEAATLPPDLRQSIYQTAASKTANSGNYAAARQLLAGMPGKAAGEAALQQLDQQVFYNYVAQEKYAEAKQIIAQQLNEAAKTTFLIELARCSPNGKKNARSS